MPKINRINHVAILVDDIDKSLAFWQDALGMDLSHIQDIPAEKSRVAFGNKPPFRYKGHRGGFEHCGRGPRNR